MQFRTGLNLSSRLSAAFVASTGESFFLPKSLSSSWACIIAGSVFIGSS
jgi:hypothetical protein